MAQKIGYLKLMPLFAAESVVVFGNAPTLDRELDGLQEKDAVFLAADGATTILLKRGIIPDIIVTDLDGSFPDILKANREGCDRGGTCPRRQPGRSAKICASSWRESLARPSAALLRAFITSEDSRMEIDAYFWQKSWGRPL